MASRGWYGIGFLVIAATVSGCGGSLDDAEVPPATPASTACPQGRRLRRLRRQRAPGRRACARGRSRGWSSRTRFGWASSASRRWSNTSRNSRSRPQISTGETLVTPENMNDPEIAKLIHPPQVENTSGASLSGAKSKKWRVIVIPKGTTHEFWKTLHAGTLKAADELGNVDVIWQGPQKEDDRVQQIQLVQNAIAAGVDGIVLAPLDAKALVEPVEAAVAKGIPVVIFDSALESNKMVSYVATNNYNGGVLAARRLGELSRGREKSSCCAMRSARRAPSSERRASPTRLPRISRESRCFPTRNTPARPRIRPSKRPRAW